MHDHDHPHTHKSITLLAIGLLIFTLFQLTQVLQDGGNLSKAKAQVEKNHAEVNKAVDEGKKMIDQLNDIAIGTQKLADAGNANAKEIVAQMNKLGIKIDPNFKKGQSDKNAVAPAAGTPPAPKAPAAPAAPAQ
jgi:hypothetical protein